MARKIATPPPVPDSPAGLVEILGRTAPHLLELQKPSYALLNYDDLRFRDLPEGLALDDAWHLLKFQRSTHYRALPLAADDGTQLRYRLPAQLEELVHRIDSLGGQWFEASRSDEHEGRRFVRSALIEEAIASSLIEGVATTRDVARELLRSGRAPRNESETAVVNNFRAMELVLEQRDEPLSLDLIRRIHATLAQGWMDESECGVLRNTDDIVVWDARAGEIVHKPPKCKALAGRLERLCRFANEEQSRFLHPLVRAATLHFMLGYEHPFADGNGRTARALFHWSMLRSGFRMYEYLPVSRRILRASVQYPRAFQMVETDEFDLTYFLHFQFKSVLSTLKEAHDYLSAKRSEHRDLLSKVRRLRDFNYRQQAVLIRALNVRGAHFTVKSHANSHGVTLQTARADLLPLEKAGLLRSWEDGRTRNWEPVTGFKDKLQERMPKQRRTR